MTAPLAALGQRFRFNETMLGAASEGFSAGDWAAEPGGKGGNTPHWILGHLASCRRVIRRKMGEEVAEDDWEAQFGMNATPAGTEGYPAPGVLVEDFVASGERIAERFANADAAELSAEWPGFPTGDGTVRDGMQFMYTHECYHIGQIGLLRRILGHERFA